MARWVANGDIKHQLRFSQLAMNMHAAIIIINIIAATDGVGADSDDSQAMTDATAKRMPEIKKIILATCFM